MSDNKMSGTEVLAAIEALINRYSDDCYSDGRLGISTPSAQSLAARKALVDAVASMIEREAAQAKRIAELEEALHAIRSAWLHEASQADGIMEEHVFALGEADRVLPRAEARNG